MENYYESVTTVNSIVDILPMQTINKLVGYPPFFFGVIQWDGKPLPIVNLTIFSVSPVYATKDTCILVLEILLKEEKMQLGILVNSTKNILSIKNELIYLPPDFINVSKSVMSGHVENVDNKFNPFCFS